jgi:protein-disulfide isomerase
MNRRQLIAYAIATAASSFALSGVPAFAISETKPAPEVLSEKSFGNENAAVTVIEYMSMTCSHCQNFHVTTWPAIKEKYVDTGKIKFIFREFPFDPRAAAAFMLARCVPEDQWYPVIDLLFRTQDKWARVSDARQAMQSTMSITGMSKSDFESCLTNQDLLEKVQAVADKGRKLGVDSTPSFLINGKVYAGAMKIEEFSKLVDPLVSVD